MGRLSPTDHRCEALNLINTKPCPPSTLGNILTGTERVRVRKNGNLEDVVMKFSKSAFMQWQEPIMLAPKQDGSIRLCVDYCNLNNVTVRDSNLIAKMDEGSDLLGNIPVYTTLEASTGYCPREIDDKGRD